MDKQILDLLLYILQLLVLTLGTVTVCGLAVHLCSRGASRLFGSGSGAVFDVTALIGTPVHELGHAAMCLLFGHRITRIKLFSIKPEDGLYGFVEHRYNRKNPWAKLGNLFIAAGPIFSGLGVILLVLFLCFPLQWSAYLAATAKLPASFSVLELAGAVFSLFRALPSAFTGGNWLRALIGLLVILPVSLHVSLSWQDIQSALGALPIYFFLTAIFGAVTFFCGLSAAITAGLRFFNLCTLSLFVLIIAFSAVWLILALLVRFVRTVISWF